MDILVRILQVILALHTAAGAVWKFSHSEQTVPTLKAIPHGGWLALIAVELLCSLGLLVPVFRPRLAGLVPIAAIAIVAEMLLFTCVHLASGSQDRGPMIYWLVVAAVSAIVAWGGWALKPPVMAPRR